MVVCLKPLRGQLRIYSCCSPCLGILSGCARGQREGSCRRVDVHALPGSTRVCCDGHEALLGTTTATACVRRDVPRVLQCEVFRLPTGSRQRGSPDSNQIVAAYVPFSRRGQPVRPTVLFSHGNAVDLGQMMPFYK